MENTKKILKEEYKLNNTQMGIYQIRNTINGKIYLGMAQDIPGILNSNRFQLNAGNHKSKTLQEEWHQYGEESFVFETLDELKKGEQNSKSDLETMYKLWLENLEPYGEKGYNDKIKTREEKLKMIAQNRAKE